MKKIILVFLFLAISGLSAAQESGKLQLLKPSEIPDLLDDSDLSGLSAAIDSSLEYYSSLDSSATLAFGSGTISVGSMSESLRHFKMILSSADSPEKISERAKKEFDVYHAQIGGSGGKVTFSSYFAPSIQAKRVPDAEYRYPFYARPPDLADLLWEDYDPARKGERTVGRFDGKKIVPYYTREDIDSKKVLAEKNLEVAWAKNPLDVLTLQIQGSGWIFVPGSAESYHIRYAGDNGRKYNSIGLALIESGVIPKSKFNKERMWKYLSSLSEEKRQAALNLNPRYIFFEVTAATTQVRGSLMVSLTDGRSVATDPKIYPPGSLAFIKTQKPTFDSKLIATGTTKLARFVLNQDEGGAIKGWNRVDFYSGHGIVAEKTSEHLWFTGDLYFFVKKK